MKLDQADKFFSLWIRYRDNWTCTRCGKHYNPPTNSLHCSHFYGRRKESVRYEPLNATAHCYGCHQYLTSQPEEHREWKLKQIGQRDFDRLTILANGYKKKDRKLEAMYWRQRILEDFGVKV